LDPHPAQLSNSTILVPSAARFKTGGKIQTANHTNHASRCIFLLNHAPRRIFSPITRQVKRSKYIANFTFSTLKAALIKRRTLPIQPQNASANM